MLCPTSSYRPRVYVAQRGSVTSEISEPTGLLRFQTCGSTVGACGLTVFMFKAGV